MGRVAATRWCVGLVLVACGGAPERVVSTGPAGAVFSEPATEAAVGEPEPPQSSGAGAAGALEPSCNKATEAGEGAVRSFPGGPGCIPAWGEEGLVQRLELARVGDELRVCARPGMEGAAGALGCWAVDPRSGRLEARPAVPLPGHAFAVSGTCHDGLSWRGEVSVERDGERDGEREEASALFAYHPDGRRAVVLADGVVVVFELASRAVVSRFPVVTGVEGELTNAAVSMWFLGEMIFIGGFDAGPAAAVFAYHASGGVAGPADWGLYNGGAGPLDGRRFGVNRDGLSALAVVDAVSGRLETVARKVPRGPCGPSAALELADPDPVMSDISPRCVAHLKRHYAPWVGMTVIADGAGWLGLKVQGKLELVWMDAGLRVTRRVGLRQCRASELPRVGDE